MGRFVQKFSISETPPLSSESHTTHGELAASVPDDHVVLVFGLLLILRVASCFCQARTCNVIIARKS